MNSIGKGQQGVYLCVCVFFLSPTLYPTLTAMRIWSPLHILSDPIDLFRRLPQQRKDEPGGWGRDHAIEGHGRPSIRELRSRYVRASCVSREACYRQVSWGELCTNMARTGSKLILYAAPKADKQWRWSEFYSFILVWKISWGTRYIFCCVMCIMSSSGVSD